ncbi:hypothetical protein Tco_0691177 [Tanacetum coccineum]
MTKVIKEEFEKLESLKIDDVSLTCNTLLEFFHEEFNRMSRMDDDLFTYEVEISGLVDIPCDLNKEDDPERQMSHETDDDMEYDRSNVEFTEWLASKFYNYKIMDDYTKNALWIYWDRGDDEVELTDEESSDSDKENDVAEIFRIETNVFDFETPTLHSQKRIPLSRFEWYEALKDGKLKEEALKNKAIMEGIIEDDDDELINKVRRFKMVKYSFGDDEEYVAVKENKYDDLTSKIKDAFRTYQEIFRKMDKG